MNQYERMLQAEMNGEDKDIMECLKINCENGEKRIKWILDYAAELFMRGYSKKDFLEYIEKNE